MYYASGRRFLNSPRIVMPKRADTSSMLRDRPSAQREKETCATSA